MTAPDTTDESAFDLRARAELALAFDPGPHGEPPAHLLRHTPWHARSGVRRLIAALLVHLLHQKPKPAVVSADIRQLNDEKRIAIMTPESLQEDDRPGKPSPFSCPDCGGVLWEIDEGEMVRYRCRVGHARLGGNLLGSTKV